MFRTAGGALLAIASQQRNGAGRHQPFSLPGNDRQSDGLLPAKCWVATWLTPGYGLMNLCPVYISYTFRRCPVHKPFL
jgi:hypothetical protein